MRQVKKNLKNPLSSVLLISLLLIGGALLISCSGKEDANNTAAKVAELSKNKDVEPLEMISSFVALAVSRDPATCQYLSPQYRKSASSGLKVPESKICKTLFPSAPSKVKAERTVVISKDRRAPKAISAVCTLQKTTPPEPAKNTSKEAREQIRDLYTGTAWQQIFTGPLVTEIVFSKKRSQWEMVTLPANTSFSDKSEQKVAERVTEEVRQKCPSAP